MHAQVWPDEIPDAAWEYGFDRSFLQDLCLYWQDGFDWKTQLDRLSAFHHYRDANGIHFIHERGKGPRPMALIITHGWPGSFIEMMRIIPMLTDPAAHGATQLTPSTLWFLQCPDTAFRIGLRRGA